MKQILLVLAIAAGPLFAQTVDPHPSVRLTWLPPPVNPAAGMGYVVYRSPKQCNQSNRADFVPLNAQPVLELTYLDVAVGSGAKYCYYLVTVAPGFVDSVPSSRVNAVLPLDPAEGLAAVVNP